MHFCKKSACVGKNADRGAIHLRSHSIPLSLLQAVYKERHCRILYLKSRVVIFSTELLIYIFHLLGKFPKGFLKKMGKSKKQKNQSNIPFCSLPTYQPSFFQACYRKQNHILFGLILEWMREGWMREGCMIEKYQYAS